MELQGRLPTPRERNWKSPSPAALAALVGAVSQKGLYREAGIVTESALGGIPTFPLIQ